MSRLSFGGASALLGFSVFYLVHAVRLPLGSAEQPGPGMFPVLVGTVLLACSTAFLIQGAGRRAVSAGVPPGEAQRRVAGVTGAMVAFCLALPRDGYGLAVLGLLIVLLRLLGARRWTVIVVVALLATAGSYYLFAVMLGVPLPAGPWGW